MTADRLPRRRLPLAGAAGGGAELAYRVDGPPGAPVLVLSNSLGTALEMWEPQMVALGSDFRVLRYDQRGHGASDTPPGPYAMADLAGDVLQLLDAIGCARASVAGVSLGGMVAMHLAAHHPERVDRIVLASTAPYMGPPEQWAERAQLARTEGTAVLAEAALGRWFTPAFRAARPDVVETFRAMIAASSDEGYAGCCEAIAVMDQRPDLATITAPTLVLAGVDDPSTSPATASSTHAAIAGSRLVVLPSAAHVANVEQPERFTDALLAHLTGPAPERGTASRRAVAGDDYVDGATRRAAGHDPGS